MDEIVLEAKSSVDKLIFLFHGYGADKNDLVPIGEMFAAALPKAEVRLPNGIEKCDEGFGRQWFALEGEDVAKWMEAYLKNSAKIISYIDSVVSEKKLSYKDVIFAGFSQGAMLSLSLGLKLGAKAAISFSGLLIDPETLKDYQGTKILLAHGMKDDVIPFKAMQMTESALKEAGVDFETAVSPNLGHAIDDYLSDRAVDFLKKL
ncbi:MAG: dienelactone hydrolase family protein [Holosporaceae bacterium]|jgi:phospholipase/carboxylesterase|nr:dienelactone hydrolase family protein [Holosporaceae bacterium]